MNSRERLTRLANHDLEGHIVDANVSAALRELDHLCEIYCEMIDEYETSKPEVVTHSMRALREDFRQAGYGEK